MSTIGFVLFGMVLVLFFFGIFALIVRLSVRRPTHSPPLIPSADGRYEVFGKRVVCHHCGHASFKAQEILLNTWLLSLLRIDWLDSSATVLTRNTCGRLTWFAQEEPADTTGNRRNGNPQ
jgi:hypothetical protein